jgi:SpoVK/Ycf46/Vps4 family AAA+-type ATPase
MLLVGIPGTGKSLLARAVAGQWGLPLLRMDLSGLLGSLVGQSESQVRQAIQLASAMAPCVLHIDEIEKALAGADGAHDSGVMAHIVGLLLTWLQERTLGRDTAQAPVFVVATANRIDRLPPELYRPGRFDRTWFLDLGGPAERAQVLRIHLAKRRQRLPDDALEELSADPHTADFSPAELELAVQTACRRAFLEQRPVDPADLLAAIGGITPYARSHEALLGELRSFAKRWAESAQDPQTPPERLRTRTLTS